MTATPPGWYADPQDPNSQRWWDGQQWTTNTQPVPTATPPQFEAQVYAAPAAGNDPIAGAKPDSYLVWAILTTLLCCLPFGIVAIINATKVDSAWARGDHMLARASSEKAKRWSMISAGAGLALTAVLVIIQVIAALSVSTPS